MPVIDNLILTSLLTTPAHTIANPSHRRGPGVSTYNITLPRSRSRRRALIPPCLAVLFNRAHRCLIPAFLSGRAVVLACAAQPEVSRIEQAGPFPWYISGPWLSACRVLVTPAFIFRFRSISKAGARSKKKKPGPA